jgi:hypothetical protein
MVLQTPHRTSQGRTRTVSTPSGARGPGSAPAMATPPFHKVPVRRGPFNYLALLSCERERAVRVENGEAVGRLDGEIREILTNQVTVGSMAKYLLSSQERTQLKIDKLLRQLSELVEEQATLEGTIMWFYERGSVPYSPLYPPNLEEGDLTNLREKLLSNELPE